jgi:hypothetical protein
MASNDAWGSGNNFNDSPLRTGFYANWPEVKSDFQWHDSPQWSTMAVYGNGNIHLKQYNPDYVSTPSVCGDDSGNPFDTLTLWTSSTSPTGHDIRFLFDWGDGSEPTVTDFWPSGNSVGAQHDWSSSGAYTVTVTAETDDFTWSSPSYYYVNIGNTPVSLTINSYIYYDDSYFGGWTAPASPNVYLDGPNWVGTTSLSIQVTPGSHSITVDNSYGGGSFWYMTPDNYNSYGNGASLQIPNSGATITVWYYEWIE